MSMKNSNDTIENETRDLPACSTVPKPNAPSHAPNNNECQSKITRGPETVNNELFFTDTLINKPN